MLAETDCCCHVVVPGKYLEKNGRVPGNVIVKALLQYLLNIKAMKDYGYFLAVTNLKSIGSGHIEDSCGCAHFPVNFSCRIFTPIAGEIMVGIVHKVLRFGVFLKSGPMNYVYLSAQTMPNYHFEPGGENKSFLNNDRSRIQIGVAIRFVILAARWAETEGEYGVLASLVGDSLGPIALAGNDGLDI
ncbi:hypothetical protein Leryth_017182 [Lithospermum erythrorhizon]|nr:hypothetical protein Leryth_017182 [Lithospermum erythrorhizon]